MLDFVRPHASQWELPEHCVRFLAHLFETITIVHDEATILTNGAGHFVIREYLESYENETIFDYLRSSKIAIRAKILVNG